MSAILSVTLESVARVAQAIFVPSINRLMHLIVKYEFMMVSMEKLLRM